MDDSLERDQLNLWEKLNRLYGDDAGGKTVPESEPLAGEAPPENLPEQEKLAFKLEDMGESLGSAALEDVGLVPEYPDSGDDGTRINEVCTDCRYGCPQPARGFVISRCRLAAKSTPENRSATVNQIAASAGSMGIEKINETCRRCRRSCKQRSTKLNKMLCLGFIPLDDRQSEHD